MNRTGTTSLGRAFTSLGLRNRSYDPKSFHRFRSDGVAALWETIDGWDSFEDFPWMLVYEETAERYPDARFVLTTRASSDVWFDSLCRHALKRGPLDDVDVHVFGSGVPQGNRNRFIKVYEDHNQAVRTFFKDRGQNFLEVCWERGDGWPELCGLLQREAPTEPFPHLNSLGRADGLITRYKGQSSRIARSLMLARRRLDKVRQSTAG